MNLLLLAVALSSLYGDPQRIEIDGFDKSAMEPCITLDGKALYWSGMNDSDATAHIYWAKRVGGLKFKYMGRLDNLYTKGREMAPALDSAGEMFFTRTESFGKDGKTLWRALGTGSASPVEGDISKGCGIEMLGMAWTLNMDCAISPDGNTLYVSRAHFVRGESTPRTSTLFIARKQPDGTFRRDPQSEALLKEVNTSPLQYAPAISADGLELYFTRLIPRHVESMETMVSTRRTANEPFGKPVRLSAIAGFAEAPSLTLDGKELYFHKLDPQLKRFCIYRIVRADKGMR